MALWGKQNAVESRPKSLPDDSNAPHGREFVAATTKGWVMQPGVASAATGNDNTSADPEILIAIRNLSEQLASANLLSIDYTGGAYADAATFDLVLTFDEKITFTSAAYSANQTVTNKAYILLSRLGATDMASDNTVACQYYSGTGTNIITFRGVLQSADAGFLSFTDAYLHFDGTATAVDPDSEPIHGIADETTITDSITLDGTDGSSTNAGDKILLECMTMTLEGPNLATDVTGSTAYRTGFGLDIQEQFVSIEGEDDSFIIQEVGLDTTSSGGRFVMEDSTGLEDGLVVRPQSGSSSGSADILNGVTTT